LWFAWVEVAAATALPLAVIIERRNGSSPIPIPLAALSSEQSASIVSAARSAGARLG
jgi:hypothetical protein